jgi:hypothetical protein
MYGVRYIDFSFFLDRINEDNNENNEPKEMYYSILGSHLLL